jgi:hypothetical protein
MVAKVVETAEYARAEINRIGGYYAYSEELVNGDDIYAFDTTKLSVFTRDIGLAGIEVYDYLRDNYDIQIEFGDIGNILAIISAGDMWKDIERLVSALSEIKRLFAGTKRECLTIEYITPIVRILRRLHFMAIRVLPISESAGRIKRRICYVLPSGNTYYFTGRAYHERNS